MKFLMKTILTIKAVLVINFIKFRDILVNNVWKTVKFV